MTEINHKQVLGIVGSPRRGGNTEILVDEVLRGAKEAGAQVEKVVLEKLPLKFYIEAGILEVNSLLALGNGPNLILSNRHLRNVLQAKGYPVHYAEFAGGHDYLCWQGTLAEGLLALIGKEPM